MVRHSRRESSFVAHDHTAVLYYAPTIFSQIGLSGGTTSLLATGVIGIVFFLVTAPAVFLIDNVSFALYQRTRVFFKHIC